MWFLNRSDTNQAVQSWKHAGSLKFRIYKEEEVYYPCSKNKGADQLCRYREADLRLCFRLCRLLVFPWGGSFNIFMMQVLMVVSTLSANTKKYHFLCWKAIFIIKHHILLKSCEIKLINMA